FLSSVFVTVRDYMVCFVACGAVCGEFLIRGIVVVHSSPASETVACVTTNNTKLHPEERDCSIFFVGNPFRSGPNFGFKQYTYFILGIMIFCRSYIFFNINIATTITTTSTTITTTITTTAN
ncbi:unnamed protein product, partial [Laminaria digitata]